MRTMFYIYLLHSNFHVLSKDSNFSLYDPLNNFNYHNLSKHHFWLIVVHDL